MESGSDGDDSTSGPAPEGIRLGGGGVRPRSGTPEEDRGRLRSNGGRGFIRVRGGL